MNKVILKGNLTKDIELRTTINNKAVARFILAVNEGYGDNQRTSYINCEVWNKLAENLAKYCGKGSSLLLEGRLANSDYEDKDGNKKYVTKVVVESIEYLDSKKSKESAEQSGIEQNNSEQKEDHFKDFGEEIQLNDEDLPF